MAPTSLDPPNTEMQASPFHRARLAYEPRYPMALAHPDQVAAQSSPMPLAAASSELDPLKQLFPYTWGQEPLRLNADPSANKGYAKPLQTDNSQAITVAVVLSGGPAPGGHNVIWGLTDGLRAFDPNAKLIGFLGGPAGILSDRYKILTPESLDNYRNTGGFDLLGSGRTKIESPEQFARCRQVLEAHKVDVLVVIGGDDSNTNAALLAEYFSQQSCKLRVLGVPKTIDGDLKNAFVETSFGFDSAVRVYSEMVSNIARDTLSARKYYHFIRLMGRSASHITLECALQTHPNLALISEEVAARELTLRQVVEELGTCIKRRAEIGKNFGLILIPEGVIEFIPEVKNLIAEINQILAEHRDYVGQLSGFTEQSEYINRKLSRDTSYTFSTLPIDIQRQLLMERDPHGNVVVSRIETEKLLISMLESYLGEEKAEGRYRGSFGWQQHFLGYEGRCSAPSNFDANYAYSLGRCAAALTATSITGYMSVVRRLASDPSQWEAWGVPLTAMMTIERRHGRDVPVIKKGLVDLQGPAYRHYVSHREQWALNEAYRFAGPIQYFGPPALTDKVPASLALEQGCFVEDGTW